MRLAAIGLGLSVGAEAAAPAPRPRVETRWEGPTECEAGARVQTMVDALLGPDGEPATATVRVAAVDAGWRASIELEVDGALVQRTVDGRPCPALADAVALIIAVTVDPLGAGTRVSTALAPSPAPPLASVLPSVAPPPAEPSPPATPAPVWVETSVPRSGPGPMSADPAARRPPRRSPVASVFIDGGVSTALLPGAGGRAGGGLALGWGRFRVVLAALHGFARPFDHPDGVDAGADVWLTAGRASGCWSPTAGRVRVPLCAGVEAGSYAARGFGLEQRTRARSPWAAVVPHVQPTLWVTRWLGLGVAVELPVALVRPRFTIDDFADDLIEVGPVGVRAGAVIEFAFFRRNSRGPGNGG